LYVDENNLMMAPSCSQLQSHFFVAFCDQSRQAL
jgi:hypothetical protein